MRRHFLTGFLSVLLIALASADGAAAADAAKPGKQVVMQGGSQGATACVACHGVNGTGRAAAGFPRLAGLSASYLVRQLEAYIEGTRASPIMEPIAKALTESEIKNVAQYYASQHPPTPTRRHNCWPQAGCSPLRATGPAAFPPVSAATAPAAGGLADRIFRHWPGSMLPTS